jgi:hypothetical protein
LPISIFTPCPQPRENLEGILGVALLEILDPFVNRAVERGSLLVVEMVAPVRQHLVERHQLDLFAFGTIRGLIQDEPSVPHACPDRLHRREV